MANGNQGNSQTQSQVTGQSGDTGAQANQQTANTQTPASTPASNVDISIDYEKLSQIIAGKQNVTEESVLKGYFKQQGLSGDEVQQAISSFKEQKKASEPNVGALQEQAAAAQKLAAQATVEKEAMLMSSELGVDLKTMPYVLKMADTKEAVNDDLTIDNDKLKEAINKVLEDIPQLKVSTDNTQAGFQQVGSGGSSQSGKSNDEQLRAAFGL